MSIRSGSCSHTRSARLACCNCIAITDALGAYADVTRHPTGFAVMPRPTTSRPGRNAEATHLSADPVAAARAASLHYVNDGDRGIRRRKVGSGFSYRGAEGAVIRDAVEIGRIRALAVPPASMTTS